MPAGTEYFYAFPAGQDSGFFNGVPPEVEELVAARTITCAGDSVKAVVFHATTNQIPLDLMRNEIGIHVSEPDQIISLPAHISTRVVGGERNESVKKALTSVITDKQFMMTQPYRDDSLKSIFQIDPELSIWLNDKNNMPLYVPAEYMPLRYCAFENGLLFSRAAGPFPLPCVIKVASSSSGDGVRVCTQVSDLEHAKEDFKNITQDIFVEEFIPHENNICIQFGVPYDMHSPAEIIGYNEQLTSNGAFLGAVVPKLQNSPRVQQACDVLTQHILPGIRERGWYGVAGIDVLLGNDGKCYFIDPNFRMTASFAFVCQTKNKSIRKSQMSFIGTFRGTVADFTQRVIPVARMSTSEQLLNIVSLTQDGDVFRFNASVLFEEEKELPSCAAQLLRRGILSPMLRQLTETVLE